MCKVKCNQGGNAMVKARLKKKKCNKGWECGRGCISRLKTCRIVATKEVKETMDEYTEAVTKAKPVLKTRNETVGGNEEFTKTEVIEGVVQAVSKVRNGFYGRNMGVLVDGTWFNYPVPTKDTPVPTKGRNLRITNEPPYQFPSFELV